MVEPFAEGMGTLLVWIISFILEQLHCPDKGRLRKENMLVQEVVRLGYELVRLSASLIR